MPGPVLGMGDTVQWTRHLGVPAFVEFIFWHVYMLGVGVAGRKGMCAMRGKIISKQKIR